MIFQELPTAPVVRLASTERSHVGSSRTEPDQLDSVRALLGDAERMGKHIVVPGALLELLAGEPMPGLQALTPAAS